jgi:hypothetical protein
VEFLKDAFDFARRFVLFDLGTAHFVCRNDLGQPQPFAECHRPAGRGFLDAVFVKGGGRDRGCLGQQAFQQPFHFDQKHATLCHKPAW